MTRTSRMRRKRRVKHSEKHMLIWSQQRHWEWSLQKTTTTNNNNNNNDSISHLITTFRDSEQPATIGCERERDDDNGSVEEEKTISSRLTRNPFVRHALLSRPTAEKKRLTSVILCGPSDRRTNQKWKPFCGWNKSCPWRLCLSARKGRQDQL